MKLTLPESEKLPFQQEKIESRDHIELSDYLRNLINKLANLYTEIANVVNYNRYPEYVAQDGQPTPEPGELMVWKDTDATTGNPTHYLVFKDGTNIVTFGSDQTVP